LTVYFGARVARDEQTSWFSLSLSLFICRPMVFVSSDRPKAAYRKCRVFQTMREMHNRWPHAKVKYRTAFTLFYSKINPKRSMNPFEESVHVTLF
jgi:hypothetical protein